MISIPTLLIFSNFCVVIRMMSDAVLGQRMRATWGQSLMVGEGGVANGQVGEQIIANSP